jgi:hypothetical protein
MYIQSKKVDFFSSRCCSNEIHIIYEKKKFDVRKPLPQVCKGCGPEANL